MADLIRVGAGALEGMAADIGTTHAQLTTGFADLSAQLLRTLPEWGEGTASREAYDAFTGRVDALFREMLDAVARMPPVVLQAAADAQSTENRNAAMWSG